MELPNIPPLIVDYIEQCDPEHIPGILALAFGRAKRDLDDEGRESFVGIGATILAWGAGMSREGSISFLCQIYAALWNCTPSEAAQRIRKSGEKLGVSPEVIDHAIGADHGVRPPEAGTPPDGVGLD